MAARKGSNFDLPGLLTSNVTAVVGFLIIGVGFYYTTKGTLDNHEHQFAEIAKKFDGFNSTLKDNFTEWQKTNKLEQDKAEKASKEERETREKMRDQFTQIFTQLTTNMTGTKVQVDTITKTLDSLQTKIDSISSVQQEGRILRQQQGNGRK